MRRILVAILVLMPAMAHTQTVLVAKANPPAALKASSSAAPSPVAAISSIPVNLVIHQAVATEDAITGASVSPISGTAVPQLVKAVKTDLTPQELALGSEVAVRLTVDRNGLPENLSIDHATNPEIAQKTLAAVSQYRFKPATSNFLAVPATITIDVKIK
jgi:TonB family protein